MIAKIPNYTKLYLILNDYTLFKVSEISSLLLESFPQPVTTPDVNSKKKRYIKNLF